MKPHSPIPPALLHRPFSITDARQAGLSDGRLRGTDLHRPFYGVRDAGFQPQTLLRRCQALAARLPADAFFSGPTAALLHGAPLPLALEAATTLHVSRPVPAQAVAVRGTTGHRVRLMGDDVRYPHSLRTSSPVRTWCELGETLSVPDLVAVGDYLIHWKLPMTTVEHLTAGLARYPGRRGMKALTRALPLLNDRAESRRESLFRVFLVDRGFTGFAANHPVTVFGYNHRIDIAFPALKVAFEYQGEHHFTVKQRREDMTRRARLEAAGWHVMELNVDDLKNPRELEARIRAFLALWA